MAQPLPSIPSGRGAPPSLVALGAPSACAVPFELGATLQITNLATGTSADFEVVVRTGEEQGQYMLGVKLLDEQDFWGPLYEPKPTDATGALPKLSDLGPGRV